MIFNGFILFALAWRYRCANRKLSIIYLGSLYIYYIAIGITRDETTSKYHACEVYPIL